MLIAILLTLALCGLVVFIALDEGVMSGEMEYWDMGYYGSMMGASVMICLWVLSRMIFSGG